MREITHVKLRTAGEVQPFLTNGMKFENGEKVIVEADRGLEYGIVAKGNEEVADSNPLSKTVKKVIRKVNPWDEEQIVKNKEKSKDLLKICLQKIKEHNLPMKLVDAEYSFDRSKIVFYFTSEGRVDFRGLVKDLASIFRVRIELKQIGVRDEARMVGGCGACGLQLCCASFLKDFNPVTIKMAKIQNLPLNPAKISGLCGRLMCCLGYEAGIYKELCRIMPRVGKEIKTEFGKGKVMSVNLLSGMVTVDLGEGKIKNIQIDISKELAKNKEFVKKCPQCPAEGEDTSDETPEPEENIPQVHVEAGPEGELSANSPQGEVRPDKSIQVAGTKEIVAGEPKVAGGAPAEQRSQDGKKNG
ncbi:MAG TPA: stage 0 sporulation family protein [Candidatus Omnitrophota bacterium]|nr:stage 0 sporulation family protein [Candidatus Omnitrophota bacterium]